MTSCELVDSVKKLTYTGYRKGRYSDQETAPFSYKSSLLSFWLCLAEELAMKEVRSGCCKRLQTLSVRFFRILK